MMLLHAEGSRIKLGFGPSKSMKTTSVTALQLSSQITMQGFMQRTVVDQCSANQKERASCELMPVQAMWFCLISVETLNQGPQHDRNP